MVIKTFLPHFNHSTINHVSNPTDCNASFSNIRTNNNFPGILWCRLKNMHLRSGSLRSVQCTHAHSRTIHLWIMTQLANLMCHPFNFLLTGQKDQNIMTKTELVCKVLLKLTCNNLFVDFIIKNKIFPYKHVFLN